MDGNPEAVARFQAQEENYTTPPTPAEWDPEAVEGGKENSIWHTELSGLARLCQKKGTRLIFLFLPYRANQRPLAQVCPLPQDHGGGIRPAPGDNGP